VRYRSRSETAFGEAMIYPLDCLAGIALRSPPHPGTGRSGMSGHGKALRSRSARVTGGYASTAAGGILVLKRI